MLSLFGSHRGRSNPEGRRRRAAISWSPTPELLEGRILLSAKHLVARTPPTVSLTAPLNNSTVYDSLVSHATALTATVSDSQSGVASVQFRVDGTPLATATPTGPNTYPASWDTTSVADGPHTLTVIATDGAGNTTTTTGTVTVVHDHPILIPTPGSPLVESGLFASLNVSWDEYGHAIAQTTTLNPFTGATQITSTLLTSNLVNGIPTVVPGVTGDDPSRPLTLAYHLPTPVQGGDVAVYNFQTGQLSDLIRFQTVSDSVVGTQGWMLIYSEAPAAGETEAPADVGVPTPTHSVLTQSAIEFGVQGYEIVEYAAEQATYSGLSDGNLIPFGTA